MPRGLGGHAAALSPQLAARNARGDGHERRAARVAQAEQLRARARASARAAPDAAAGHCCRPPATLACYERLAKISHFAPLPIQSEPAQCATVDLVRLDRVTDARPDRGGGQSAAGAPVQHGGGGGGVDPRRRRAPPRPSSARRSPRSPRSIPIRAAAATTFPGAKLVGARQGQCARCQRRPASQRRHLQADRPAGRRGRSASRCGPWPAPASRPCSGPAPTATTRSTSISI